MWVWVWVWVVFNSRAEMKCRVAREKGRAMMM